MNFFHFLFLKRPHLQTEYPPPRFPLRILPPFFQPLSVYEMPQRKNCAAGRVSSDSLSPSDFTPVLSAAFGLRNAAAQKLCCGISSLFSVFYLFRFFNKTAAVTAAAAPTAATATTPHTQPGTPPLPFPSSVSGTGCVSTSGGSSS